MDSLNINNSHLVGSEAQRHHTQAVGNSQVNTKDPQEAEITRQQDKVTLNYRAEAQITYSSSLTMNPQPEDQYGLLRELVTSMLKEQGVEFQVQTANGEVDISEISQEEAQELVSEDGYFGVDQTSTRIVDFAIAIAGGDPARLDAIKTGIEDGFNQAKEAFGGTLPEISYETYDAIMEKLDAWADIGNDN